MKLHIYRQRTVLETNILGKPTRFFDWYFIYRRILFFKRYLSCCEEYDTKGVHFVVSWHPTTRFATMFKTKEEAQSVINKIKNNPDIYILRKKKK